MTPGTDARELPDAGAGRVPRADAAPARPTLEGEGFTAALDPGRPPRALTASVLLWLLAAALELAVAAVLWRQQDRLRDGLAAAVLEQDPSATADVVAEAARWAFNAGAGSVALVGVVLALLARPLRRGRSWASPLLLLTGAIAVVVAVVVQDLVRSPARDLLDDPLRLAVPAPVPVVVAAAVTLLLPAARAWLRRAQARER